MIFLALLLPFLITASYPASSPVRIGISLLVAILVLLHGYVAIKILWRINQLKK